MKLENKMAGRTKKTAVALLAIMLMMASNSWANDSEYFTSGNQLIPLNSTCIRITKEILTIEMGNDDIANVDVYYEMYNDSAAHVVKMGFEAEKPYEYNENNTLSKTGHPYIGNFKVIMNGKTLDYSVSNVVMPSYDDNDNDYDEGPVAYHFDAHFKAGKNIIHHTYSYKMANSVICSYSLDYKLSPAMRWANHQIDDFTLRISAKGYPRTFEVDDFIESPKFTVAKGTGKIKHTWWMTTDIIEDLNETTEKYDSIAKRVRDDKSVYYETFTRHNATLVSLRDGTVEFHSENFRPTEELVVSSAEIVLADNLQEPELQNAVFYNGWCNAYGDDTSTSQYRVQLYLPYAYRGMVFQNKEMAEFYKNQWWYMPDETVKKEKIQFYGDEEHAIEDLVSEMSEKKIDTTVR